MPKRKVFDLDEKVLMLNDVDSGMKKKDVASKYGLAASSLSTILKHRESILASREAAAGVKKN